MAERSLDRLIDQAIDRTISPEDFDRLQDALVADEGLRHFYLRAVELAENLAELAVEPSPIDRLDPIVKIPVLVGDNPDEPRGQQTSRRLLMGVQSIAAAMILIGVGAVAFWLGRDSWTEDRAKLADRPSASPADRERHLAGHATLRQSVDLAWSTGSPLYRQGDVLAGGRLQFDRGLAIIDLFCGATLVVEGPATLELVSDWSVRVLQGRIRAEVPPAARGFVIEAAGSQILDLGTEFVLEVESKDARVEVLDGEVELRGGQHHGDRLQTGQGVWLKGTRDSDQTIAEIRSTDEVQRLRDRAEAQRIARWEAHVDQIQSDPRLIAYYPMTKSLEDRRVLDRSPEATGRFDGHLIGSVERTTGRFGSRSIGLGFSRLGARMRTRIDGSFQAFTFACWVRIDSLVHRYNALFMGDGYENGEPHWQIRDDGRLMVSVMVDETQVVEHYQKIDQRIVQDAGLHRVYSSEPIWDVSQSGQWMHLAAVYDPTGQLVTQYVNGEMVAREAIPEPFQIDTLKIGPAEVGNWGQPFRQSPWFAVRNLDGVVDELLIYNAALEAQEIHDLYEGGKPLDH